MAAGVPKFKIVFSLKTAISTSDDFFKPLGLASIGFDPDTPKNF